MNGNQSVQFTYKMTLMGIGVSYKSFKKMKLIVYVYSVMKNKAKANTKNGTNKLF